MNHVCDVNGKRSVAGGAELQRTVLPVSEVPLDITPRTPSKPVFLWVISPR